LLDAFEAAARLDYRTTILYAAIAVESLAATTLSEEYDRILTSSAADPRFRIVSIPQSQGRMAVKDPVYECLGSETRFRSLLHERPLYLMGRSLMIDEEALFIRLQTLYQTRNKIVHLGDASGVDLLSIDRKGAALALDAAVQAFKWFGKAGSYPAFPSRH
jgi:hypothetical protein